MTNNNIEDIFDEMLEETCKNMSAEDNGVDMQEKEEAQKGAKAVLQKFLKYIRSSRFDTKCENYAKEFSLNKKIVKNHFIGSLLGKIADVLHLGITITCETIKYVVEFVSAILNRICDFCYNVCINIIKVFTLNCGSF